VQSLVDSFSQGRDLGYLGEPTVNVLQLNVALSQLAG
jgi:K+-transporting ATPase ATPase C chain